MLSEKRPQELSPDQLKEKYNRLATYAAGKKFVWVYRAEGEKTPENERSGGNSQFVGSWFATSYELALDYQRQRGNVGEIKNVLVYALAIPEELLEQRGPIDRGLNQVNVLNPELVAGKILVEKAIETTPETEDYLNQFAFVKEYREKSNS